MSKHDRFSLARRARGAALPAPRPLPPGRREVPRKELLLLSTEALFTPALIRCAVLAAFLAWMEERGHSPALIRFSLTQDLLLALPPHSTTLDPLTRACERTLTRFEPQTPLTPLVKGWAKMPNYFPPALRFPTLLARLHPHFHLALAGALTRPTLEAALGPALPFLDHLPPSLSLPSLQTLHATLLLRPSFLLAPPGDPLLRARQAGPEGVPQCTVITIPYPDSAGVWPGVLPVLPAWPQPGGGAPGLTATNEDEILHHVGL